MKEVKEKAQLEEVAKNGSSESMKEKAKCIIKGVDKIKKLTYEMISFLDQMKFDIMLACGESITNDGKNPSGYHKDEEFSN